MHNNLNLHSYYFPELADKEQFRMNKTHNSRYLLVLILFYNSHIDKNIDMHSLAFLLLFYDRISGMLL